MENYWIVDYACDALLLIFFAKYLIGRKYFDTSNFLYNIKKCILQLLVFSIIVSYTKEMIIPCFTAHTSIMSRISSELFEFLPFTLLISLAFHLLNLFLKKQKLAWILEVVFLVQYRLTMFLFVLGAFFNG